MKRKMNVCSGISAGLLVFGLVLMGCPTEDDDEIEAPPKTTVSTIAGSSTAGLVNGSGDAVQFKNPFGIAAASDGTLYVADKDNNAIRKITPAGVVSTLATGLDKNPRGIAVGPDGTVYVGEDWGTCVRKIASDGTVSIFAGVGDGSAESDVGTTDGALTAAKFNRPYALTVASDGTLYVMDNGNGKVRKIADGQVTTLVMDWGSSGLTAFNYPESIAVDASGNLYLLDLYGNRILKLAPGDNKYTVSVLAGKEGGYADGTGISAAFNSPGGMTIGPDGNLYVADAYNGSIRKVTPEGAVSTYAGSKQRWENTDGDGETTAGFLETRGIAADKNGTLYVVQVHGWNGNDGVATEDYMATIRKITRQ